MKANYSLWLYLNVYYPFSGYFPEEDKESESGVQKATPIFCTLRFAFILLSGDITNDLCSSLSSPQNTCLDGMMISLSSSGWQGSWNVLKGMIWFEAAD